MLARLCQQQCFCHVVDVGHAAFIGPVTKKDGLPRLDHSEKTGLSGWLPGPIVPTGTQNHGFDGTLLVVLSDDLLGLMFALSVVLVRLGWIRFGHRPSPVGIVSCGRVAADVYEPLHAGLDGCRNQVSGALGVDIVKLPNPLGVNDASQVEDRLNPFESLREHGRNADVGANYLDRLASQIIGC